MCINLAILRRRHQFGLSLVEVIIFVVIVSVGVVGLMSTMNVSLKHSADPMLRKQAVAMAEAIMDEVLAKDFANPAGGFTEADFVNCSGRLQYDDVADYNCFGGAPATAVIGGNVTLGAAPIAALAAYTAIVNVAPVVVSGVAMNRVTVTVTGGAEPIQLFGYRANY